MTEKIYTLLIAEDDQDIVEVLKMYLENLGYHVLTAANGEDAYRILQGQSVDLCIFDIMMPKMNGFQLIKKARENKASMPIIVLSAKREDSDKILGLDLGADDYLTKPFNPLEVIARVKANLRRINELGCCRCKDADDQMSYGALRISLNTFQLFKNEEEINVTPIELKILGMLMKKPGRVYTKVQICEYLNGKYFENDENTIMVHISNLREKIEDNPKNPEYLLTVRGLGYKLGRIK